MLTIFGISVPSWVLVLIVVIIIAAILVFIGKGFFNELKKK